MPTLSGGEENIMTLQIISSIFFNINHFRLLRHGRLRAVKPALATFPEDLPRCPCALIRMWPNWPPAVLFYPSCFSVRCLLFSFSSAVTMCPPPFLSLSHSGASFSLCNFIRLRSESSHPKILPVQFAATKGHCL